MMSLLAFFRARKKIVAKNLKKAKDAKVAQMNNVFRLCDFGFLKPKLKVGSSCGYQNRFTPNFRVLRNPYFGFEKPKSHDLNSIGKWF